MTTVCQEFFEMETIFPKYGQLSGLLIKVSNMDELLKVKNLYFSSFRSD